MIPGDRRMAKHWEKFSYNNYDDEEEFEFGNESEIHKQNMDTLKINLVSRNPMMEGLSRKVEQRVDCKKNRFAPKYLNQKFDLSHTGFLQENLYFILCLSIVGIISLIGTAFILNKEWLAIEMIKIVFYIFIGGVIGYGFNKENNNERA